MEYINFGYCVIIHDYATTRHLYVIDTVHDSFTIGRKNRYD